MNKFFGRIGSVLLAAIMAVSAFFGFPAKTEAVPKFDKTIKNVIFMIGDGMGFNSIERTIKEEKITDYNMAKFPMNGESKTRSADNLVTDSAAGATALCCGVRVNNNAVSVYPSDSNAKKSYPMSLIELSKENGKATGVITTDSTSGATPAAFTSHSSHRDNEKDITTQQLASNIDLLWGAATASFSASTAKANGFEVVYNKNDMDSLSEGTRSFAQFTDDVWHNYENKNMPTLSEMTAKAIDLVDDDEDGFFLMVEGAHIDKNSHNNNAEGMKDALQSFDNAIGVALDYAKTHEGTMVIVTADHETGGIKKAFNKYFYTTTDHTGANVPLFVYGFDGFISNGDKINNTSISIRTARAMGFNDFPRTINR